VSNQLQRLVGRGHRGHPAGRQPDRYRITDPCVTELLDLAWCLTEITQPGPAGGQ
jgi:hypothetical protein